MSDLKISELPALSGSDLASGDQLAVVDSSASQTSKLSVNDLIANGVTLISDDTIPGAKILFAAGDVPGTALADSAVTTAKIADDAVTAAKLANNSSVTLVTSLPTSGDFTGQLALDTDDNSLYAWDGSAWQNVAAQSSIAGSTAGEINIVVTTSGTTTTISATIDNTTSAAQFLAGPTGSAGTVGYRTIVGTDLPTATASAKGAVIVNGDGLALTGDTIGIDNTVSGSSTHHVVTYDVNGLITGGRAIAAADLPIATSSAVGGVIASDGLTVDVTGNLSIDNTVTAGTYTKVTVTNKGVVSTGDTLVAADIPDHSADKLTSGTIGTSLIANDAITADKIGDQATTKFGGAAGSDNVTIFPTGDFKGQFFYDETTQDLYIYTGSAFVPITVLSGNLVNAGAYNASTNQMSSVTSAGSSAGFSVGNALPAPAKTNLNHYVVVDTSGTGTGAAPAVALAPPDMLLSQGVGTEYSLIDVSNAIAGQTASNISLIATGDITATDVQAGITELDTEKLPKAGGTMTGNLELNNANVVFEGSSADDYETTLTVTNPTADRTITLPDVTGTVVTTGDTGSVTSTMITDGTIVNADINASAEIAVSKLANGVARQLLETAADGTTVQFASNIDIPGTLDVTGEAIFDSALSVAGLLLAAGKVSGTAGSAAAPGLYFGSDADTGIYSPGANQFGISTAGTSRIVVDSSGNVGIGTTSPGRKLEVNSGTADVVINAVSSDSGSYISFEDNSTTGDTHVRVGAVGNNLRFDAGNAERLRIDSSGNVGVGTTSPNEKIEVAGDILVSSGTDATIYLGKGAAGSDGVTKIKAVQTGADSDQLGLAFFVHPSATGSANPDEAMRLDASRRLLIGTSNSSNNARLDQKLAIANASSSSTSHTGINITNYSSQATVAPVIDLKKSRSNTDGGTTVVQNGDNLGYLVFQGSDGDEFHRAAEIFAEVDGTPGNNDMPGRLVFSTTADGASSPTERVRIDSSGNVGIGQTSPAQLLHLTSTGSNAFLQFSDSGSGGSAAQVRIGSSGNDLVVLNNTSSNTAVERLRVDSSGRLLVGTSSATTAGTLFLQGISGNTSAGAYIHLQRGNIPTGSGSPTGSIFFADNSSNLGASITSASEGAWTSGSSHPSRLVFSTTANSGSAPTERLRIDSSGNVGIGVSSLSSSSRLTLLESTGNGQTLEIKGANTGGAGSQPGIKFTASTGDNIGGIFGDTNSDAVVLQSGGTERVQIDSSGNVKIASEHLRFNTSGKGIIFGTDGSSNRPSIIGNYTSSSNNNIVFNVTGSERMRLDNNGRLLVGRTSNPTASGHAQYSKFVSSGNTAGSTGDGRVAITRGLNASGMTSDDTVGRLIFSDLAGGTFGVITVTADATPGTNDYPGRMSFATTKDGQNGETERLRINRGGISYFYSDTDPLVIGSALSAGTSNRLINGLYNRTSTISGGTTSFKVYTNGNVENTNDSYGQISDVRLKENIVDAPSQWDDFKAVRFRKYNFKEETGYETFTQLGVIAQELELTSPGLVYETADQDAEGNDLGTTTKAVKSSVLTKKALVALQEAMERIEQLEAKVAALEAG